MQEATKSTTTNTLGRRYLNEKQLAEITGMALSTIRNHRAARKGIPFVKMQKSVRYDLSDVIAFMDSNKVETNTVY